MPTDADEISPDEVPDAPDPDEHEVVAWSETERGWRIVKLVGLVLAVAFLAATAALALQNHFDGQAEDSVDVGFLQDMIHHHGQAIQLGVVGADNATDHSVRHFAQEALIAQQYEVGYMTALLEDWGYGTGDLDRDAMTWMDMPTGLDQMPGMATEEQITEFRDLSGLEADEAFLRLMTEHHRGGLHMSEEAAQTANDERVRALALRMMHNQRAEIREYAQRAEALGITI